LPRPRRRSRPPELPSEPFGDACFPAEVTGRAERELLVPADPVSCGFFRGGWPVGGFCVPLPGADFEADGADGAGLAEPAGLAAAGFAVVLGLPEVTALFAVSLLTGAGLAGAAGAAGAVPPVADAAPGTVGGYRLNSAYCWPRVHTFVVTQ
jgi:hypothetical protein